MSPRKAKAVDSTLKSSQIKEMLESETATLVKLKKEFGKANARLRVPIPEFVERSFMLHRNLIERWGGWRYQGAEVLVEDQSFLRQVAGQEFTSFVRSVQQAVREKTLPAIWGEVNQGFSISAGCVNFTLNYTHLLSAKTLLPMYGQDDGRGHIRYEKLDANAEYKLPIVQRFQRNAFGEPTGRLNPIVAKVRVEQRISAAVMRALEEAEAPPVLVALYEKLFQRLGEQVWGAQATPIRCTLSCAPSSFLRLGEYGENSCYHNGGGADYSKFWLASDCADSFVALFHRMKPRKEGAPVVEAATPEPPPVETSVSGRAWGIACPTRGAVVSNFYMLPSNMVMGALKQTLMDGLDIQNAEQWPYGDRKHDARWHGELTGAMYVNPDTVLVADKSETKRKLFDHYLCAVIAMGKYYGFHGHAGHGPQFIRLEGSKSAWDVVGPPRMMRKYSMLWPYKDANLRTLLAKSITEDGTFSPLSGPQYPDDEE